MAHLTVLGGIEIRRRTRLEGLQIFLASLRQVSPFAHVVLFNRSVDDRALRSLINQYDVESVDARTWERAYNIPPLEIEIARFLSYGPWLEGFPDESPVLMTDVLDVAWQTPLPPLVPALHAWEENQVVGACPYNRSWVQDVWPGTFETLLPHPIVCCGVVAGSAAAVRQYISWYADRRKDAAIVRRGFDSGVLNGYPDLARTSYWNATCMHLGYTPKTQVEWEEGRAICEGLVPALIHQYNRHPALLKGLVERWT